MCRKFVTCFCCVLLSFFALGKSGSGNETANKLANSFKMPAAYVDWCLELYKELDLQQKGLEKDIFLMAYKGYLVLEGKGQVRNPGILSIADFSQSNRNKRLYIVDLRKRKLLVHTYVSHGKNSGAEMATSFSNVNNSNKSVLGFLITADTYNGSNGLSLKFRGMERGINDLVQHRAIVVHGSKFVNERELQQRGEMVNSLGCPAVPMAQSRSIINTIKGGSVYFIYHPDEFYAARSPVLNTNFDTRILLPPVFSNLAADTLVPPMPPTGLQ
jgi:hypothetical protein